jgi:hypothetical protein
MTGSSGIIAEEVNEWAIRLRGYCKCKNLIRAICVYSSRRFQYMMFIEQVVSNFILQVESKNGVLIPSLHAENDLVDADPVASIECIFKFA